MRIVIEDGQGNVLSDTGAPIDKKSIYSTVNFLSMVPAGKWALIQASTDDNVVQWRTLINQASFNVVDLNDLPQWFVDGLQGMVDGGIITQTQMNNFLEV